ncbi:hypothetical protein TB2_007254 [Malus domestica]|uniref:Beta-amylase n=1 Tax=Malus domestica TaxID=3750 RepID=A0A498IL73_MALDO|nr:hypothetical protein DVH24_003402 [Malus domestica]
MALSIMHQISVLSETPIKTTEASSSSVESVSASPMWKSSTTGLTCKIQKPEGFDRLSPLLSPCRSLVLGSSQPDLSMACRAFVMEAESPVLEHQVRGTHDKGTGVPVYVMMLFDSVMMHNSVNREKAMNASLQALKSAGVDGVMMDVW